MIGKDGELVYVEMRFENGTVQCLEDSEAQNWLDDLDRFVMLGHTHGIHMQEHSWKHGSSNFCWQDESPKIP